MNQRTKLTRTHLILVGTGTGRRSARTRCSTQWHMHRMEMRTKYAKQGICTQWHAYDQGLGAGLVREFRELPTRPQFPLGSKRTGARCEQGQARIQYSLTFVGAGSGDKPGWAMLQYLLACTGVRTWCGLHPAGLGQVVIQSSKSRDCGWSHTRLT